MGAQKDRLIKTVHLSAHNKCFGYGIRKIILITCSYLKARVIIDVSDYACASEPI